jgi:hypothetical protein
MVGKKADAVAEVSRKEGSKIQAKVLEGPLTGEAGVVGRAKAGGGVEADPIFIGTAEKVNRGVGTISPSIEKATGAVGEWAEMRVRCLVGIRAKEEAVAEGAKATKVVNG